MNSAQLETQGLDGRFTVHFIFIAIRTFGFSFLGLSSYFRMLFHSRQCTFIQKCSSWSGCISAFTYFLIISLWENACSHHHSILVQLFRFSQLLCIHITPGNILKQFSDKYSSHLIPIRNISFHTVYSKIWHQSQLSHLQH